MKPTKSLSFFNLILIIVMTVYSFSSMSSSFFMMGLKSFPWFLISAFFILYPMPLLYQNIHAAIRIAQAASMIG